MKKIYISPRLNVQLVKACSMLCGSAKGSVDATSINTEAAEDLSVKGHSSNSNSVEWEDWQ